MSHKENPSHLGEELGLIFEKLEGTISENRSCQHMYLDTLHICHIPHQRKGPEDSFQSR